MIVKKKVPVNLPLKAQSPDNFLMKPANYLLHIRHKKNRSLLTFLLFTGFVCVFFIQSCGFQLNRNKIHLPRNATSIHIGKIENNSFIPHLNLQLRDLLAEKFAQNSIIMTTQNRADLAVSIQINSMTRVRNEFSLNSDGIQSYEFLFSVKGKMTVLDNITQSSYLKRTPISASYSIKKQDQDLTSAEIEESRYKTLQNLTQIVVEKLTKDF